MMPPVVSFVEDSDIDFEMAVLATRRVRPSAQISRVSTYQEAMKKLVVACPSLIVVDVNLPDGNGIELLSYLSEIGLSSNTNVVVFSTSSNPVERDLAVSAGAREFISKPSRSQDYIEAVASFVKRWT